MCMTSCPGAWLLAHQRSWEDVSNLGHLSMSTEMPLHFLSSGENAEFSDWEGAAVNCEDTVIRAWHLEHSPVALLGRHDQWLFLKDLDFR